MVEKYLSAGMHIGMKSQTKNMKRFVYKIRSDGLGIIDLKTIEERIEIAARFISKFDNIMVVARKKPAEKAVKKFAEIVGAKAITGRFLPGIITNPSFREYYEPDVIIITDPEFDRQAIKEAVKLRIPIISLVDTGSITSLIDLVIPVNNKGRRSLAMTYWMLANEIMKERGKGEIKEKPDEFEVKK